MKFGPCILVTGAASGIGAAFVRRIAAPGVRLMLHTRANLEGLSAVASVARSLGAEVAMELGDLADPSVPVGLVHKARTIFGRLDQLVSNAGKAQRATFDTLESNELLSAFASMPVAFFHLAKTALPDLCTSPQGRIVAVSSFVAHSFGTNNVHFPATSAAKAALEALAKSLAVQLAPAGVTVNCVVPGFVRKHPCQHAAMSAVAWESARTASPNGRLGEPQDIAEFIAFLLSPAAQHITGQAIHIDGGLLLP
ncbi:SDR family oxidoreductase [Mesorhizobium sp.]|uniref:SDR family NAD(P)-dependent oxidoreductase n=1 Tax=Mesorhizobium sp. TaxID=1871066 RepID=UPI000FE78FCF|nr:SDR family oxidoreductase [Mesorhizobium sp.]RWP29684.1 MAG: SDR family oxidoreductase [Mesorhizobium sp.]